MGAGAGTGTATSSDSKLEGISRFFRKIVAFQNFSDEGIIDLALEEVETNSLDTKIHSPS